MPILLRLIKAFSLKQRLVITGLLLAAAPLLLLITVLNREFSSVVQTSQKESLILAGASLDRETKLVGMTIGNIDHEIRDDLRLAHGALLSYGGMVQVRGRRLRWQTTNQLTNQTTTRTLPLMFLGHRPIRDPSDLRDRLVDDIGSMTGASCTLFQRMNTAGDMLRISSSIKNKAGNRAVGTYLPTLLPDGKPNTVIQTILRKETYSGNASAYEPVLSSKGDVIGMLYVGRTETDVAAKIQHLLSHIDVGKGGEIFVLSGDSGDLLFTTALGGLRTGRPVGLATLKAARAHPSVIASQTYYLNRKGVAPERMLAHLQYFAPRNWVLGVAFPERSFLNSSRALAAIAKRTHAWLLSLLAASLLVSALVWLHYARRLSCFVSGLRANFRRNAHVFQQFADRISRAVEHRLQTAGQEITILQDTAHSSGELQKVAAANSAGLAAILLESTAAESQVQIAATELHWMEASIAAVNGSNAKIRAVVHAIDGIAFQSKILALNANIEAARAGAAGATFAIVADEFGRLARLCADAAETTTELLGESVKRTAQDAGKLKALGAAVGQLSSSGTQIRGALQQIQGGTQQELQLAGQIGTALEQISQTVQQEQSLSARVTEAVKQLQAAPFAQAKEPVAQSAKGADVRHQTRDELVRPSGGALDTAPVLRKFLRKAKRRRAVSDQTSVVTAPASTPPARPGY